MTKPKPVSGTERYLRVDAATLRLLPPLGPRFFGLYVLLLDYASSQGSCFPSVTRLARDLECSVRQVQRGVRVLKAVGLLEVEARRDGGGNATNVYRPRPAAEFKSQLSLCFPLDQALDELSRRQRLDA